MNKAYEMKKKNNLKVEEVVKIKWDSPTHGVST